MEEHYSALGYEVLASALAARLGTSTVDAIRTLVLEPAGMTATTPLLTPEAAPQSLATGYRSDAGTLEPARLDIDSDAALPAYASTPTDLLYLAQWMPKDAYLNGELQQVGGLPGYRSYFFAVADGSQTIVALANYSTIPWAGILEDLHALAAGNTVAQPTRTMRRATTLPQNAPTFAGEYRLPGGGAPFTIDFVGDSLMITGPDGLRTRLYAENATDYFTDSTSLETVRIVDANPGAGRPRVSVLMASGKEVVLE